MKGFITFNTLTALGIDNEKGLPVICKTGDRYNTGIIDTPEEVEPEKTGMPCINGIGPDSGSFVLSYDSWLKVLPSIGGYDLFDFNVIAPGIAQVIQPQEESTAPAGRVVADFTGQMLITNKGKDLRFFGPGSWKSKAFNEVVKEQLGKEVVLLGSESLEDSKPGSYDNWKALYDVQFAKSVMPNGEGTAADQKHVAKNYRIVIEEIPS